MMIMMITLKKTITDKKNLDAYIGDRTGVLNWLSVPVRAVSVDNVGECLCIVSS